MSTSKKEQIGFLGLGAMGFGMAANLVKSGYQVKGYDVFAKSVERFVNAGGLAATSLSDSATGCGYYVCMVATASQAQSAIFDQDGALAKALPNGATLFLCSTVPSAYALSVQDQLKQVGRTDIHFIDCPVSGGAKRAADGTLSIMAGASDEAIEKGKFVLEEMADTGKLYIVPGGIGAGSNMKMVHQVLAAIHILAASEAMGLAARLGLDATYAREEIIKSEAWSWMHENRSPRMLEEDYVPGVSALTIILKDVGIITSMARLHKFPTPLSSAAEQVYLAGLALGYGSEDDAGMVRMYYPDPVSKASQKSESANQNQESNKKLVLDLLSSIHLCGAAEAIAFAHSLGLELNQFSNLVNAAAGGSRVFQERGPEMMKGLQSQSKKNWTSENQADTTESTITKLSQVVQAARDLNCPLYLGNAALNLFLFWKRNGWGESIDASIVKFWGD